MLTLVIVNYRLAPGHTAALRADFAAAAPALARLPGLAWKIWSVEEGAGCGVYLFDDAAGAADFVAGDTLGRLAAHPSVSDVDVSIGAVDLGLSRITGAAAALGGSAARAA